jgi:hypothetical protein
MMARASNEARMKREASLSPVRVPPLTLQKITPSSNGTAEAITIFLDKMVSVVIYSLFIRFYYCCFYSLFTYLFTYLFIYLLIY